MIRLALSYAGSPWLLWHQIKPTDTDVGGRDPGGLRWKAHRRWLVEHVTRLHSEPESNTGVGQRRGPCLEKRAGCIPGELGDVTPHQAGLKQFVDGTSLTDFLFKVSILSNSVSSVICSTASREGCGASAGTLHHGFFVLSYLISVHL